MQSTPQVDNENDHLSLFLIPECHLMQGAPSGIPTTPHFLSRYFHSPGILCDVELTTPAALTWHRSLGLSIVWMLHLHKSTCLVQIWLQRRCAHPLSKHPLQCLVRHFKALSLPPDPFPSRLPHKYILLVCSSPMHWSFFHITQSSLIKYC